MSLFSNLTTDGMEKTEDRLSGGFGVLETDVYLGEIKLAYASESERGAKAVNLVVMIDGKEYRETIYVTNAKGENFYMTKSNPPKKAQMPGFVLINELCLVTVEKPLAEMDIEEKTVKLWDHEAKAEVPKAVDAIVELHGQKAYFAIWKNKEDKSQKVVDGDKITYVPTGEFRDTNNIDKVFHAEAKVTFTEAENGITEGVFMGRWQTQNKDKVRDKTDKTAAGAPGKPKVGSGPAPKAGGAAATATPARASLFGKK